jgi:tetratricopeptide (TPR) repeat protein
MFESIYRFVGKFDEAVACCEAAVESASSGKVNRDASALVVMSSAKIQMAMVAMQAAHYAGDQSAVSAAQASLGEIHKVFERALEIEPAGVEALFRYAHFKSMLGDFTGALELASRALTLARSKEEMEELKKLNLMTAAQVDAISFIQKTMRY